MSKAVIEADREALDLETLTSRCLGNLDLVERVLTKFTTQLDADLEQLERALVEGNASACASLAHRIKGMSANVEAKSLHGQAVMAEDCARHDRLEGLAERLVRMREERSRLGDSFAKLRTSKPSKNQRD